MSAVSDARLRTVLCVADSDRRDDHDSSWQPAGATRSGSRGCTWRYWMSVETTRRYVIRVLHVFCDAFARRDVDAVVRLLVPREDVMVVTSEEAVLRNRAQLDAFLQTYAHGDTTYSWEWERDTVAVSGEMAWLLAEGMEIAASPSGEVRTPYRMTMLCQRDNGQWKLAQVHGSSPHHPLAGLASRVSHLSLMCCSGRPTMTIGRRANAGRPVAVADQSARGSPP